MSNAETRPGPADTGGQPAAGVPSPPAALGSGAAPTATVVHKRLPRRPGPAVPAGELMLEAPPEVPSVEHRPWSQLLALLPMAGGAAALAGLFAASDGNPVIYVLGALFGVSLLGFLATVGNTPRSSSRAELVRQRRDYLRYLASARQRARRAVEQQRTAARWQHPAPDALWSIAASSRLWERRPTDPDFGLLRLAVGATTPAVPLIPPGTGPLDNLDPVSAVALRRFILAHNVVRDQPIAVSLRAFSRVVLRGPRGQVLDLTRAMLAQAVTWHAPGDLLVALAAPAERLAEWDWLKWLPHLQDQARTDASGPQRLVAESIPLLEDLLEDLLARRPRFSSRSSPPTDSPHLLVLVDGVPLPTGSVLGSATGVLGCTVFDLSGAAVGTRGDWLLFLDVGADGLWNDTGAANTLIGAPDVLSRPAAEALAHQLAPHRLPQPRTGSGDELSTGPIQLTDLLGVDLEAYSPQRWWEPRANRDRLRLPIGVGSDGGAVELDLKESAQDGMGPHGMLIGATGSGKSELLRTLVLGLAMTHPPDLVNFVLVDFKGGATFVHLDRLPHTSAVITNLADELPLVDRMTNAIGGELVRRQELLRSAGNFASQREYERTRVSGAPLPPLPSLLIVIDEFSELLSAKPDFIDMFVQIGRVGRSLGVHLLLASQRLEEGRLRGLDTHLSYRIGLRTFSAAESRVVLGVPDAYELPRAPGHGYLRFGGEPLTRFKAAYVSGVHRTSPAPGGAARPTPPEPFGLPYRMPTNWRPATGGQEPDADNSGTSVLDVVVDRLRGHGGPAHQVWLPPLAEPPTLDQILPPLPATPGQALAVGDPAVRGRLAVPVAVVDLPFEQRRDLVLLDLAGAAGHVAVVGGPQSGKSTLVRTLICALALTHSPRQAQFYCLDFGGGSLASLRSLPHVGSVGNRKDPDRVRRTVAELYGLLGAREQRFAEHGIDSIAAYRRRKAVGEFADDPYGDVFLVVDGWSMIRAEFEDMETMIGALATRGLSFGVHVIATATRWMDFRPGVRDLFGSKVELRLGDSSDSYLGRPAASVPTDSPGRGLTGTGHHFLSALPRLDGRSTTADLPAAVARLVDLVRDAWPGLAAPPVRLLPREVPYERLPRADRAGLPIGLAEVDLQPVYLDFDADPHVMVFGEQESGKTSFLRALARAILDRHDPESARLIIVDYRRGLLGEVTSEHLIGYTSSQTATRDVVAEVARVMRDRLPSAEVTPAQLRNRSWWHGPELYLLVDDYDLVVPGGTEPSPLLPLLEFLPQARDVGLHVVLTRRSGGAARALFEPVLMRLRELAVPTILLSGHPDDGILVDKLRPTPLPPGRGRLVTRQSGARLVQLAWTASTVEPEPSDPDPADTDASDPRPTDADPADADPAPF